MCTGIRLIAQDGAVAYARTLEFGQDIASNIIVIPRNYHFIGTPPSGTSEGLPWKANYAVVGVNALQINHLVDGVNEKGLAGGLFYFPDYAHYQDVAQGDYAKSIAPWELMTWILTNFSTVNEVRKALPTIKVANTIFAPWNIVLPIHAIVHDAQGTSVVIEYVNGKLFLYDAPLGVFTNSPSFDWHMTNLKNYVSLSCVNRPMVQLRDLTLTPLGQGSGMLGMPGDFTPPSRFVRAVAFSEAMLPTKSADDVRDAVFHVLNLFNIPKGVVCHQEDDEMHYDYTQWTGASDLQNKRYYFHTYDNRQIRCVDLLNMNLDEKEVTTIPMHSKVAIEDVTPIK